MVPLKVYAKRYDQRKLFGIKIKVLSVRISLEVPYLSLSQAWGLH